MDIDFNEKLLEIASKVLEINIKKIQSETLETFKIILQKHSIKIKDLYNL